MNTAVKTPRFATGSIMRHVVNMTITAGLGLTFTFLIEALTLFWLARLANQTIIAGMAVAGSVVFFNISLSVAMMIPSIALVSRSIGRGDLQKARRDSTASLIVSVLFQGCLSLIILLCLQPLLHTIGGDENPAAIEAATTFLRIAVPSLPFFAIAMTCSGLLRAEGDGRRSMMVTLIGGLIVSVLDPLLILGFGLEIKGAAIATVIARIGMAAIGLYYLIKTYDLLAPLREVEFKTFLPPFIAIAIPTALTQLSTPVGNIILIRFISSYGEADLAAFGAVFRVLVLAFGGIFALSGAVGGIIGQNYGAEKLDRVKETYVKAIIFGAIYTLCAWLILLALRPLIPTLFSLTPEGTDIVNHFVYTAWYFGFVSMLFVSNAAFNNLGKPFWSTALNWARDILLTLPVVIILTKWFGALGVIYTMVLLGIIIGSAAALLGWSFINRVARGEIVVEKRR